MPAHRFCNPAWLALVQVIKVPCCAAPLLCQNLVKQLTDGTMCLSDRGAMVRRAGEIGIPKRNSPKWCCAQNITRRGFAVLAEEETRLWADICASPAI